MYFKSNIIFPVLFSIIFLSASCDSKKSKDNKDKDSTLIESLAPDTVFIEEDAWVIDEDKMNDIPLTSESPKVTKQTTTAKKNTPQKSPNQKSTIVKKTATVKKHQIDSMLTQKQYISTDTIQQELVIIPLEETQTIASYNKKGVKKESFQVVTAANGDVEQIIFTNKKHKDAYDVQTGMTGKDIKKLRKELKHMIKNGQVFLYDDESNIMYLMDSKNNAKEEITEADIEPMEVQAIIWKDKKHHQKK